MAIYKLNDITPSIHPTVYISPNATVIGNVTIGERSSIWFNCVLRGDCDAIIIGKNSNIQDMTICHEDSGKPLVIGDGVTIGHQCVIHGCTIEDNCLVGMGSIIMNGAKIGRGSIIGAGSVILENTVIPPFSLVAGAPGKIKRQLDESVLEMIKLAEDVYSSKAVDYASEKLQQIG